MINDKAITSLVSILMFFVFSSNAQGSWEIDKNRDGIRVYTRVEAGSDFKAFKAIMLTEASSVEIIQILMDADNYTSWYGFTKTSKLLKHDQGEQYNYVETIFPWPYKNRDMVYKMSIDSSNVDGIKIHLLGIPNYIPARKRIVRMKKAEGYILLKTLNNNTEITYVFHSEPGETIPAWLANNSIAELPFQTLSGLRRVLQSKHHGRQ